MQCDLADESRRFAGLWCRFTALFLDFLLLSLLFFPITKIVKGTWIMGVSDHRWVSGWIVTDPVCLLFLGIIIAYFILLEGLIGATLGKLIVGIRVISVKGAKPGLIRSSVRNLLRLVDSLPVLNILGVVLILKSGEKARFGDRIAETRVIRVS
jgi:uncharacterized RDD family membrane protein YckC